MLYALVKFINEGWGTRINNHDVFHSVEVFVDKATALEVAVSWCGEKLTKKGNLYFGGSRKSCKLFITSVQE